MNWSEFVRRWRDSSAGERQGSQTQFSELCARLREFGPNDGPNSDDYCAFELGAAKSGGGDGFADVAVKDHFGWEYKGKRKERRNSVHGWEKVDTPASSNVEATAVAVELVRRLRETLGPDGVRGAYLYGSLAKAGFEENVSDIDLLIVTERPCNSKQRSGLAEMHERFTRDYPAWEDRVDAAYLSVGAIESFKTRESDVAIISPGEPFHVSRAGRDWMQNWYDVREFGVALCGPEAREVVPPISVGEFVEAVRRYVRELQERPRADLRSQAFRVLSICRAVFSCRTGHQVSKQDAAAWAEVEFPEWAPVVRQALRVRSAPRHGEGIGGEEFWQQSAAFIHVVGDRALAETGES